MVDMEDHHMEEVAMEEATVVAEALVVVDMAVDAVVAAGTWIA
jgi:hypothetical protein